MCEMPCGRADIVLRSASSFVSCVAGLMRRLCERRRSQTLIELLPSEEQCQEGHGADRVRERAREGAKVERDAPVGRARRGEKVLLVVHVGDGRHAPRRRALLRAHKGTRVSIGEVRLGRKARGSERTPFAVLPRTPCAFLMWLTAPTALAPGTSMSA